MCGIFGCICKDKKKLNKAAFNLLGIYNDSRGGDSCGIFIDGNVEYGVEKEKLYKSFLLNSKLLPNIDKCKVAIGHCRKASVGKISLETAQPVVIKNDEGEIEFVLIHNGTLLNHDELAKKYLKDKLNDIPAHFTDSYIMAHIFYYHGYDVLKEYLGAGVFVTVDYRQDKNNPTVYLFKGESKATRYSVTTSEERPLYLVIKEGEIWFSSIKDSLCAAVYGEKVLTLYNNVLHKIVKGKLFKVKEYDRKDKYQEGSYRHDYTLPLESGYSRNSDFNGQTKEILKSTSFSELFKTLSYQTQTSYFANDKLSYDIDGRIWRGSEVAHGEYVISPYGYIQKTANKYNTTLWVYAGYLMKSKECFEFVEMIEKKIALQSTEDFIDTFPEIIRKYSAIPVYNPLTEKYYVEPVLGQPKKYTGEIIIPFNTREITLVINKGKFSNIFKNTYKNYELFFDSLAQMNKNFPFDKSRELSELNKYLDKYASRN